MSQIEEHLKWCLKDPKRLVKTKLDFDLAQKHVKKSEYNYGVVQTLETTAFHSSVMGGRCGRPLSKN